MSRLKPYDEKRDFTKTSEPPPRKARSQKGRSYVIQEHHARRLHYDLRLEHDGALLSWAVPKGPSLDPHDKRLAVHVEDHPVEYGSFEGTIPAGEYGAGEVLIWDKGDWSPEGDVDKMLKDGELKFEIHGEKLQGRWVLVRFKDEEKNWLLIKEKDEFAEGVIPAPAAVEPQLRLDPEEFSPQLAELANSPPEGEGWIHEIKLDGYRIVSWITDQGVRLMSRNGVDWTDRFPKLARELRSKIPLGTTLDGEVVCLEDSGRSSFSLLQEWLSTGKGPEPLYYVFDIIALDGEPVMDLPLTQRKEKLKELLDLSTGTKLLRYSDHVDLEGKGFFAEACAADLEGIVSKRADSKYVQRRAPTWVKTRCQKQEEFVVGGYTPPAGERVALGALLVGQYEGDDLVYCGKVGTGFDDRTLKSLHKTLSELEQKESPFAARKEGLPRSAHWVKPQMVVDVRFSERTPTGALRHPVFVGVREDKKPEEAREEVPMAPPPIKVTHPERVLFPDVGLTKGELVAYYSRVAEAMLPHIKDRPVSVVRCPEGTEGECFFQKHATAGMPHSLSRETGKKGETVLSVSTVEDLLTLIQFGVIEIHTWGSRLPSAEDPDLLVFDLDPGPDVEWSRVVEAGQVTGEIIRQAGMIPFVKVSGGKGLHVSVPVNPGPTWTEFKDFAHQTVKALEAAVPGQFVTVMTKAKRAKKIFLDYLRNGRGATSVAPYSVRARPGAPVSVPVTWEQLTTIKGPAEFSAAAVEEWLPAPGRDPWAGFEDSARELKEQAVNLMEELASP